MRNFRPISRYRPALETVYRTVVTVYHYYTVNVAYSTLGACRLFSVRNFSSVRTTAKYSKCTQSEQPSLKILSNYATHFEYILSTCCAVVHTEIEQVYHTPCIEYAYFLLTLSVLRLQCTESWGLPDRSVSVETILSDLEKGTLRAHFFLRIRSTKSDQIWHGNPCGEGRVS